MVRCTPNLRGRPRPRAARRAATRSLGWGNTLLDVAFLAIDVERSAVRYVVKVVLYEDLHDIVLLAFFYGGFVVTGALEQISDRVGHLVYLDAFVPSDGDTVNGLAAQGPV